MKTLGIIFSNIHGGSLGELTDHRTVASLPFGGRYRFIDFVLSNLSNSGIYKIGIITKYNYRSLMDHLGGFSEWDLNRKNEGVQILPPFASGNTGVYKGKLEALHSAVQFIDNPNYDYALVCDSIILCNIDYREAIKKHEAGGNDVTIICSKEAQPDIEHTLVLKLKDKKTVDSVLTYTSPEKGDLVGMGMFIFSREVLVNAIKNSFARGYAHLEKDFIQKQFNEGELKLGIYEFKGPVLRNKSIKTYYDNNMALLDEKVNGSLFDKDSPIYTKVRDEIPTYYGSDCKVSDCIVADGCTLHGEVERSILFRDVDVGRGTMIKGSIIMQGTKIGKNVKLECVILDKNVTISDNTVLKGTPSHPVIIKKGESI